MCACLCLCVCVCVCVSKGTGETNRQSVFQIDSLLFFHTLFYQFTYLFWFYLILICFCLSLYTVEEIRVSDIKLFGTAECLSSLVADRLSAKSVTVFGTSIKSMSRSANFAALSLGAESIVRVSRNKSCWPLIHFLHFCLLSG